MLTRFLLLLLAVLLLASPARADNRIIFAVEDGYTNYHGSDLWYRGSAAFTRSKVYYNSRNYCGYATYYYSYTPYYAAPTYVAPTPAYVAPKVPAYSADWKNEVTRLAAQRDDHQAYLTALAAMGIQGQSFGFQQQSFGYLNYGQNLGYSPNLSSAGVNAQTLYGYSVKSLTDYYSSTDLNSLYQQSARLTQNAQSAAQQANSEFSGLVDKTGTNAARVAAILAKGQSAATALRAADVSGGRTVTTTTGIETRTAPASPTMPPADGGADPALLANFTQYAVPTCAQCHSGADAKAGFRIADYPNLTSELQDVVISRLFHSDPAKRMPQDSSGKHVPLDPNVRKLFVALHR